ncbi:hypothetical protein FRB94_007699 [Tulasnella sp. JGI-2019a]|nr:hypothetical protein FRB93_007736 [Tulasnella sp. JGI-2019a]KAG8997344.1 hypothetical protein FRB94_007699 [Tulasnella sp. JGI-2019a]
MSSPSECPKAKSDSTFLETSRVPEECAGGGPSVFGGQGLPSYNVATHSDASVPGSPIQEPQVTTFPSLRVNHICIKEQTNSVKGEWTIDPNVRVPASLMAGMQEGEERVNLALHSKNGSVAGKIRLISDLPSKSFIYASSQNGSVTMKFPVRHNQRFYLKAHSQNGSVTARIPPDFQGPVTFMTKNGSLKFSDRVEKRLAHLTRSDNAGKAFIGSWEASGNADIGAGGGEDWAGDELVLSSEGGSIRIEYADEPSEFSKVRKEIADAGPIGGAFKYAMKRFSGRPFMGSDSGQS